VKRRFIASEPGYETYMSRENERQQLLVKVAAALNDHGLDSFDTDRVQGIVTSALESGASLTVDDGGGLHEASGIRVGTIRRAPSGEWIIDGQNVDAAHADAEIPAAPACGQDEADSQR
jgi:hypothetical protein